MVMTFCNGPVNKCLDKRITYNKINKRIGKSSSEYLLNKRASVVSKMVGEAATPTNLSQAGGPGDLTRSVQKRGGNFSFGIGSKSVRNRLNYSGNKKGGVDKKHNSYARFLARKVGGVLRQDKIINDTWDYSTNKKCTSGDCKTHKCRTERMPPTWDDTKATGKKGNPGITVRSICGNKICKY
jgi:hypothetical protein